jgi:hypothetical protein
VDGAVHGWVSDSFRNPSERFLLKRFLFPSFYFLLFPRIGTYQGVTRSQKKIMIDIFLAGAVPLQAMTAELAAGSKGPDKERSPRRRGEQTQNEGQRLVKIMLTFHGRRPEASAARHLGGLVVATSRDRSDQRH